VADCVQTRDALSAIEAVSTEANDGSGTAATPREVVVVGAGYSGVELAAVVAERLSGRNVRVRVVTPGAGVLEGAAEGQRQASQEVLSSLGVQVLTGAPPSGPSISFTITSILVHKSAGMLCGPLPVLCRMCAT
jgi:NADH:ubiquinone reductase (non-electrogenic)